MLKPYYSHSGVTIYHGDCREILPQIPTSDLILSDPPYGTKTNTKTKSSKRHRGQSFGLSGSRDYPEIYGDDRPFSPDHLFGRSKCLVLWGANHYADRLPAGSKWLIWDKRCGGTSDDNADCEMAWTNLGGVSRIHRQVWRGFFRQGVENAAISGEKLHPTQKPIALMNWCLLQAPSIESVCDPYMGSGTTLVSAKSNGIKAVGIDIEEHCCEIAAQRLSQEVFDFNKTEVA